MSETSAVKILGDEGDGLRVGGYGVVFHGKDVVGDTFLPSTDLWLDKLSPTPPVLFDHGGDATLKRTVVGRVTSTRTDDVGLWIEAKLSAHHKYLEAIRHLVNKGVLGWSSGAVGHLVDRAKGGVLNSWAIAEFSLTGTPAEPRTLGVRELKSIAAADPLLKSIAQEAEQIARASDGGRFVNDLPDSAFAFIKAGGMLDHEKKTVPRELRQFPHHDEDGDIDVESLKSFLGQEHEDVPIAHMMWHARQAGLFEPLGIKAVPFVDDHDAAYIEGAPGAYLELALKFLRMADSTARDRLAMERAGTDSHGGNRLFARAMSEHKSVEDRLGQLGQQADDINRGEDGAALVSQFRTAFELLDLEEVA